MKLKHVFWTLTSLVGLVTLAFAGLKVFERFFGGNLLTDGYVDCSYEAQDDE